MPDNPPIEKTTSPRIPPPLPIAQKFLEASIATLSHELRTPLTAIKGYTTTLIRNNLRLRPAERMEYLLALSTASDRMTQIISRLEQMAQLEQGKVRFQREPLNLAELVQDVVLQAKHVSTLVPIILQMEIAQASRLPLVIGDTQRLREVIEHLLENAINYSPQGGQITFGLGPTKLNAKPGVELRVQDEGIGIAEEHQERIFDPFFQIDMGLTREVGGMGLGLAYCRRVIELLEGILEVKSELGKGSTFIIRLLAVAETY